MSDVKQPRNTFTYKVILKKELVNMNVKRFVDLHLKLQQLCILK